MPELLHQRGALVLEQVAAPCREIDPRATREQLTSRRTQLGHEDLRSLSLARAILAQWPRETAWAIGRMHQGGGIKAPGRMARAGFEPAFPA